MINNYLSKREDIKYHNQEDHLSGIFKPKLVRTQI
jgi:hypothetical protein